MRTRVIKPDAARMTPQRPWLFYWLAQYKDGGCFTSRVHHKLPSLDKTKIGIFAIIDGQNHVVWKTTEYIVAYRRRARIQQGYGHLPGCHIIELPNKVVYVFEGTRDVKELPTYAKKGTPQAKWWNTSIKYMPSELRTVTPIIVDQSQKVFGV